MKKLIAFCDIHGNTINLMKLKPELDACDTALFLGDGVGSLEILPSYLNKKIIAVKGNCDFFCPLPVDQVVEIEKVKIFITHGHSYNAKNGNEHISTAAKAAGAQLALFGHSHNYSMEDKGGVLCVNVGSLGTARTKKGGEYLKVVIDGGKIVEISPKCVEN